MDADAEMVVENLNEHIKHSKFAPVIADIVKRNENVHAKREIERTRLLAEAEQKRLANPVIPPWVKEGITHKEWFDKIVSEKSGVKDV